MKRSTSICLPVTLFFLFCFSQKSFCQYILNGSATQNSCNCYTLTPQQNTKSGSVWNSNKISLDQPFDFWFKVFLGCNDGGADGIVFILQPISTSIGTTGEGMGFDGISPSIGIALDTWQNFNLNDPAYDHISIQANGQINHNNDLAGPLPIAGAAVNVEDCQWHRLRISWDPVTHWLKTYFDNVLRVEKQIDLVSTIFNNNPMVYWGFSGATGGAFNLQQFCTALDPIIKSDQNSDTICIGQSIKFTSLSESFAPISTYNWTFGDGGTSNQANPPIHTFPAAGIYPVTLTIRGQDGCQHDTTRIITVGKPPDATLAVYDTCFTRKPRLLYQANEPGWNYQFTVDGTAITGWDNIPVGSHQLQLVISSSIGCGTADTAAMPFTIKPVPEVAFSMDQSCKTVSFSATGSGNGTVISQWNWNFGDGQTSLFQNPAHTYATGNYQASLWALASNGCTSDTAQQTVSIEPALVNAGSDTTVIIGEPFHLNGSGNGSFDWLPAAGLSDPTLANPETTLFSDQTYFLTVTTVQGCIISDTVLVKAYEGPTVYVPNAFTPNGDGLNDILRPVYVGITRLDEFMIFNRWGQLVFTTKDMRKGWDGRVQQKQQGAGTYIWFIKGLNYQGKSIQLKGTVTIVK